MTLHPHQSRAAALFAAFLLVCTLFASAPSALAQLSGKGEIVGVITDPSGAVIPGATVVATSTTRGTKSTSKTTSAGNYTLSPLDADTYIITVSANGFKTVSQQNVVVNALEIATVNLGLTLGGQTETVTVTEAPPQLETSNATLGATMSQETYSELPIAMGAGGQPDQRRASDYVLLMPGVQNNETSNNLTDNTGPINGSGSKGGASGVYIEGMPFFNVSQEGDNRFVWSAVSVDTVNQLQVQTSGYPAIYEGQGVQNFDLKRGSNTLHGALYEYFRNTALDTWGFYAPSLIDPAVGHAVKPVEHMNEFGLLLSGPIIKNKLFLLGNYDGYRYSKGAIPSLQSFPTIAESQGNFTGVFGSTTAMLFDPTTGTSSTPRTAFNGTACGLPAVNAICPSHWDAAATKLNALVQALPASLYANQNPTNNFLAGLPFGLSNFTATGRIDYVISDRHNISLIIAAGRQASVGPAAQTTSGRNNGPLPFNYGQGYAPKTKVDIFEDTYTINQHMVNQFKYGFARYYSPSFNLDNEPAYAASNFGIPGLPVGQASTSFPVVSFTGTDAATSWGGDTGGLKVSNQYMIIDNFQWVFGKHSLTFGGEITWLQYQDVPASGGSTALTAAFASAQTQQTTSGGTVIGNGGQPYASFLVGQVNDGTLTSYLVNETGARFRPISPYVQDDWKINSKLTVNLGLRYDFYPSYTEAHNVLSFFNPAGVNVAGTAGTLLYAGNGTNTCNCKSNVNNYKRGFGPRIGFAYQSDPKTVWRGSWGVMYAHGNAVAGGSYSAQGTGLLGFSASGSTAANSTANTSLAQFVLSGGYPASSIPTPLGVASGPNYAVGYTTIAGYTGTPQSVSYADPYYGGRAPQYIDWNFGFQRSLTPSLSVSATYVGSQGHFESPDSSNARGLYINQLNPQYLALAPAVTALNDTFSTAVSKFPASFFTNNNLAIPANFNTSQSLAQMLSPFPNYKSIADTYGNVANSNYNSLQVSLSQRTAHGLSFVFNYIWSKAIDDGGTFRSGYGIPAAYSQTGKSWAADRIERGVSTTDQPQHIVATGVYELPFGKGKLGGENRIVRILASNYKVSGIYQLSSGSPLAVTASACQTNPAQSTCSPTVAPGFTGPGHINGKWGTGATALGSPAYLSSNAFVAVSTVTATPIATNPYSYTFGDAARTAPFGMFGPGAYDIDLSLRRSFGIPKLERTHLTIEGDIYNLSNHTQFGGVGTTWGNSNFGQVSTQVNSSRDAQLSGRIEF